jgi:hypothetical protein
MGVHRPGASRKCVTEVVKVKVRKARLFDRRPKAGQQLPSPPTRALRVEDAFFVRLVLGMNSPICSSRHGVPLGI